MIWYRVLLLSIGSAFIAAGLEPILGNHVYPFGLGLYLVTTGICVSIEGKRPNVS